jgi:4-hydroxybenzoate polyprenyltransferase
LPEATERGVDERSFRGEHLLVAARDAREPIAHVALSAAGARYEEGAGHGGEPDEAGTTTNRGGEGDGWTMRGFGHAETFAGLGEHSISRARMIAGLIKTVRPHQWVKNLFVLAPMFFHKDVFLSTPQGLALNLSVTGKALAATGVFCLLAGAVYTINDLADVEADRVHPVKRHRPIASGEVPEGMAWLMAVLLVVVSLGVGFLLNWKFGLVALLYFVENLLYTFKLKKIAFLDVGLIAFGFVLRVVAGGLATGVKASMYMLACTALLALFLGFGKRRHELEGEHAGKQRAALEAYGKRSLNVALVATGIATAATYFAYTLDKDTEAFFQSHYLWLTAPFTVFGIVRFLFLVSGRAGRGRKAESPTQEMLSDVPFVLNLVVWVLVVFAIVYRLRPS